LETLQFLIDAFIDLPSEAKPDDRTINWVMTAFERLSRGDVEAMRGVYLRLKKRFGGRWGGRLARLGRRLAIESNATGKQ